MVRGKPGIKIRSYKRAQEIVDGIGSNGYSEIYLRSVVSSVTGSGSYADGLSFAELQSEKHRILGVARRVLRGMKVSRSAGLESRVDGPSKTSDSDEQLYLFR